MLSGNCQAGPYLYRSEYRQGSRLIITRQHMTAEPKLQSFILYIQVIVM